MQIKKNIKTITCSADLVILIRQNVDFNDVNSTSYFFFLNQKLIKYD